ncbi:MAG: T9SS type A sorting domain-containing protein [Bacteroidota bacterium]|nr:T9SS type A sorting domain-containing protein [Bacteroidota bacterium]
MRVIFYLFILYFISPLKVISQTLPKLGNDTLLDIACWNVEWFGDINNGPTDEALQYNNIKALMLQTDFDILGMEEISNITTYNNLSMETAIAAKYDTYISTFSATQKMGLFWKKSMFDVIGFATLNILTNEYSNFATRPPLQVCLKTKGGTKVDTLYVIVIHMKANTGDDAAKYDSYTRRQAAAAALKTYTEQSLVNKKYVIIGDWNDDLSVSIYNALPTPYQSTLTAGYTFPTKELTDAGKKSYAFGSAMIDHIMQSKTLDSFYLKGSAKVFDIAGNYISNFSNNTSDHYPVYAFYNWSKLTTYIAPVGIDENKIDLNIQVYPNPARHYVSIKSAHQNTELWLYDLSGKLLLYSNEKTIDVSSLQAGFYQLLIFTLNGNKMFKLVIE